MDHRVAVYVICILDLSLHIETKILTSQGALCTTRYNPLKGVCYWSNTVLQDQASARATCENAGGTLAVADSAFTSDLLKRVCTDRGLPNYVWLGYDKVSEKWYDGTKWSWTDWLPSEPSTSAEECLELRCQTAQTKGWNDEFCNSVRESTCQIKVAWVQGYSEAISPASAVTGKLLTEGSDKSIVQCSVWCLQNPDCEKYRFKKGHCSLYAAGTDVLNVSESEGRLYSLND